MIKILLTVAAFSIGMIQIAYAGNELWNNWLPYEQHSDRMSPYSGSAVSSNRRILTVNPSPRGSYNRHIQIEATKGVKALSRYRGNAPSVPTLPATEPIQRQ